MTSVPSSARTYENRVASRQPLVFISVPVAIRRTRKSIKITQSSKRLVILRLSFFIELASHNDLCYYCKVVYYPYRLSKWIYALHTPVRPLTSAERIWIIMKKVISIVLLIIMLLTLCACDDFDVSSTAPAKTAPTTKPTTEPLHTHTFSEATCTTPKRCSCGATEGKANGHEWKNATCSTPKTCMVCGTSTGLTAGHDFSDGFCTICGKDDPDYTREIMVWIPTKGGTKYHTHAGCSNMDDPQKVTQSEAESRGFTPCKRCH